MQDRCIPKLEVQFVELVDRRYANRRATVLISNLEPGPLADNLGAAVWRRLYAEGGIETACWDRIVELLNPSAGGGGNE